jgi:hypothetical protein
VVVQDNNAIATAQQTSWLILDIALNAFTKFLLKMIKEFSFASGIHLGQTAEKYL